MVSFHGNTFISKQLLYWDAADPPNAYFVAIQSPKFTNMLQFYPHAQNVHATFLRFFFRIATCLLPMMRAEQ